MRIWTNGCFDLLHMGHVRFLQKCASLGDLTIWVNTDSSVSRLKGPDRPILPLAQRAAMLEAAVPAAHVCSFEHASPIPAWERVPLAHLPHIYVKEVGAENSPEVVFLQLAGVVCAFLPRVPGISTSEIIKKCQPVQYSSIVTEPSSMIGVPPVFPAM